MKKRVEGNMVYITLRRGEVPELTKEQEEMLEKLKDRPVDTSDIPELDDEWFKRAQRGVFFRPVKEKISARFDKDVVAWFKSKGSGYQARMNEALREHMFKEMQKEHMFKEIQKEPIHSSNSK